MNVSEASSDKAHLFNIRIYYEDTDTGGIVYYANYLKFAERARTEMLRDYGAALSLIQEQFDLAFVVRRCCADYHHPARLDDQLVVRTKIKRLGGASLDLDQRVYLEDQLLASLNVRLALIDQAMRPARFPPLLIAALRPQYEA